MFVLCWCSAWATEAFGQAGWSGAPTPLAPTYNDIATYGPRVAVDVAGNARAIWLENSAAFVGTVRTARYDAATKVWSAAETLSDPATTFTNEPQVALDGAGNAVASWTAGDGASPAQARRRTIFGRRRYVDACAACRRLHRQGARRGQRGR